MILITGHQGFVGSHLLRAFTDALGVERIGNHLGSWETEVSSSLRTGKIDTVIHCGAISDNQYKALDIFDWNVYTTKVLADYCAHYDSHLIFISSQTARQPTTLYGHTKKLAEFMIKNVSGLNACIFQPFNIYGEDESMKPAHCQSIPYRLKARNLEVLWETCRDYIHVQDCVRAIQQAVENRCSGTYHLGTGVGTPSHKIAERFTYNEQWQYEERPPHIEYGNIANPERFLPGWQPRIKILERLHE